VTVRVLAFARLMARRRGDVPILLLEMLRAEEEALAPGYATLALHTDAPRSPPPI